MTKTNVQSAEKKLIETNENLEREIAERKKAEENLIISQNRLEYVKQIGALASSSLNLGEVLESILKGTLEASGATAGVIFLKNEKDETLSLGTSIGLSKQFVKEYQARPVQPGEGLAGRISETGEPIFISNGASNDLRVERNTMKIEGLNAFIGVPIYAASEILGVMSILTHPPKTLSINEITLASAIGAHVGYAIRNAQHFEERMRSEIKLLNYQKELQTLTSQMSLIEEHEKRRIATELHDCIAQPLALSKIKLSQLNKMSPSNELKDIIGELLELIELTIKETRTLTFELSPPILYELGLSQAFKWLIDQFREKHDLKIILEDNELKTPFDHNIRFFIFQAVRELLVNIVKHANASNVNVSVINDNDKLCITVEDNGTGFPDYTATKSGYGLFNIRERMNHINGQFEIDSNTGRGTRVTLVVPFSAGK
jgi:signal transduction histidine kinase